MTLTRTLTDPNTTRSPPTPLADLTPADRRKYGLSPTRCYRSKPPSLLRAESGLRDGPDLRLVTWPPDTTRYELRQSTRKKGPGPLCETPASMNVCERCARVPSSPWWWR